jgi:hypothetical protein
MRKSTNYRERRVEIKTHMDEIGVWAINKSELARKFGVSESQIRKDVDQILKTTNIKNLGMTQFELARMYRKAMFKMDIILDSDMVKDQISAANTMRGLLDSYTNFLEKWNVKSADVQDNHITVGWVEPEELKT